MIIIYCKRCPDKPYYTIDEKHPEDDLCPRCRGYLEEIVVEEDELDQYTPFNHKKGYNDEVVNKTKVKEKGAKRKGKSENQITNNVNSPLKRQEVKKWTVEKGEDEIKEEIKDEIKSERPQNNNAIDDKTVQNDDEKGFLHYHGENRRRTASVPRNAFNTQKDDVREESIKHAPHENELKNDDGRMMNADSRMMQEERNQSGENHLGLFGGVEFEGKIFSKVIGVENSRRSFFGKIRDYLVYRQSFSDQLNSLVIDVANSKSIRTGKITCQFYGEALSTSSFGFGDNVRVKGFYLAKDTKIYIDRMSNYNTGYNLNIQRSDEDRRTFRITCYIALALFLAIFVVFNKDAIFSLANSVLNWLKCMLIASAACGAVIAYFTRNSQRLRFRDRLAASICFGVIIGSFVFFGI